MKLIWDAVPLDLYPMAQPGFSGGTELAVKKITSGLAAKGHIVHLVVADLTEMEQRGPTLFYWPKTYHPTTADAVVCVHSLERIGPYTSPVLALFSNGLGADLGPGDEFAGGLDGVGTFTDCHTEMLTQAHPKILKDKCFVTGLGVELSDYAQNVPKVPGRMLYANDPQRALTATIEIFELVQKEVPDATLNVAYDFDRSFNNIRWGASHIAEKMWWCKERIDANPGIRNLGALTREEIIREQLECSVHCYPSDPPNQGSQIDGLLQRECAAAGCALVLSSLEAFPEMFTDVAALLPVPGQFLPDVERRYDTQDWAAIVVEIMKDPAKQAEMADKSRALAQGMSWSHVVDRWESMLSRLVDPKAA